MPSARKQTRPTVLCAQPLIGAVTEQRLYQLVRQSGPITDHTFEIQFLDPGVEACAFTFG
jgi:hypothetical protein